VVIPGSIVRNPKRWFTILEIRVQFAYLLTMVQAPSAPGEGQRWAGRKTPFKPNKTAGFITKEHVQVESYVPATAANRNTRNFFLIRYRHSRRHTFKCISNPNRNSGSEAAGRTDEGSAGGASCGFLIRCPAAHLIPPFRTLVPPFHSSAFQFQLGHVGR